MADASQRPLRRYSPSIFYSFIALLLSIVMLRQLHQTLTPKLPSIASVRFAQTMAAPPQSFVLDKAIFNQDLYKRIHESWFGDLPANASSPSPEMIGKIFGVGRTPEQKKAFDDELRELFHPALDSISPSKFALPPFTTWEDELAESPTIASPFLAEIAEAQKEDLKKGADTALSLVLLLDQIPRNIWREPAGLKLVYTHYDRLSHALLHSCITSHSLLECPVDHESFKGRPVYASWFMLPLLHSEYLPSHDLGDQRRVQLKKECEAAGDDEGKKQVEMADTFGKSHREAIERFGRYPHRNEFVGRESTQEEEKYLETADTWGVTSTKNKGKEK